MGFVSVLGYAQQLVRSTVRAGDTVIDATLGNGNDAAFLLSLAGKKGQLYGFDIQLEAVANSTTRMFRLMREMQLPNKQAERYPAFVFFLDSHERMIERLPESASGKTGAVMFNLGYLPGGTTRERITTASSTLNALTQACQLIRKGGVITIVLYPGHDGGRAETDAVEQWTQRLPLLTYQVLRYQMINRSADAPYLIAIQKQ